MYYLFESCIIQHIVSKQIRMSSLIHACKIAAILSRKSKLYNSTVLTHQILRESVQLTDLLNNDAFMIDDDSYKIARISNTYFTKILLLLCGFKFNYLDELETILLTLIK